MIGVVQVYNNRGKEVSGPVKQIAISLGGGVGLIPCPECGGDGLWDYYPDGYPHTPGDLVCIDCKGTGKVPAMIYMPPKELAK